MCQKDREQLSSSIQPRWIALEQPLPRQKAVESEIQRVPLHDERTVENALLNETVTWCIHLYCSVVQSSNYHFWNIWGEKQDIIWIVNLVSSFWGMKRTSSGTRVGNTKNWTDSTTPVTDGWEAWAAVAKIFLFGYYIRCTLENYQETAMFFWTN